jgi:hypothetical protein
VAILPDPGSPGALRLQADDPRNPRKPRNVSISILSAPLESEDGTAHEELIVDKTVQYYAVKLAYGERCRIWCK